MTTLNNVTESHAAVKRMFEIQQSLYIRDDKGSPVDARKPTLDELDELFGLLYTTGEKLESAKDRLTYL